MSATRSRTRILVEAALMIALAAVLSEVQFPADVDPWRFHHPAVHAAHHPDEPAQRPQVGRRHRLHLQSDPVFAGHQPQPGLLPDHRRTDRLRAAGLPAGLLRSWAWPACRPVPSARMGLAGIAVGTVVVCLLRFVCSFLSGYIVWKDYDYAFEWLNNFGWGAWFTAHLGE